MVTDKIETFGDSLVQHGPGNDRVYLMKVRPEDCPAVIDHAIKLAVANDYSKLFAKAAETDRHFFRQKGFLEEARVPGLFNGTEDGCFFSKFIQAERRREQDPSTLDEVIDASRKKATKSAPSDTLPAEFSWRPMRKADVHAMAALYRQVFETYPFPIHDPGYLEQTMDDNLSYHGIFKGKELVALSSAEFDRSGRNVEMTDFATLPAYRGHGFATYLLKKMEQDMFAKGMRTAYTIARAYSFGMNITFAKHGYDYGGTLTNNTQISGRLESMNVWYKPLTADTCGVPTAAGRGIEP